MQPYAAEWLSIIPPIVAIGLALMTKEVFSSLLVGIFTGTLIYAVGTGGNIVMGTTEVAFKMMAQKLDFNIIIFCSLLGALVYVITMAGGTKPTVRRRLSSSRAAAQRCSQRVVWALRSLSTTTLTASRSVPSCDP